MHSFNQIKQSVSLEIKVIYLFQSSFYWSLLFSHFFDERRKDFWGMFIHHIATVSMLNIAYISNYIRIGMMVLFIHDWAHPFVGATKCFNYIKWRWSCDEVTLPKIFMVGSGLWYTNWGFGVGYLPKVPGLIFSKMKHLPRKQI